MAEFFPGIPKIKYEGPQSDNPFAFKFYNPDEVVAGRKMKDHLRFSMAWWHTLCANGTDMFGVGTVDKTFGTSDPMDLAKAKVEAGFEVMEKTGIEYFAFHDRDIAPEGDNLAETNKNLDVIVDMKENNSWDNRQYCAHDEFRSPGIRQHVSAALQHTG